MSGHNYHYIKLKNPQLITKQAIDEYNELFPKLINTVLDWWNEFPVEKKTGWQVVANSSEGIIINDYGDHFENPITIPLSLSNIFKIGWEHRNYGIFKDPKQDIAEKLFKLFDDTKYFKNYIIHEGVDYTETNKHYRVYENDNDNEVDDYECDDRNDQYKFTPYCGLYFTGDGDPVYCVEGEEPDYTACSSDGCGYCGRCRY